MRSGRGAGLVLAGGAALLAVPAVRQALLRGWIALTDSQTVTVRHGR